MNYLRCKCGKLECFESGMTPRDCEGCEECGTTFAASKGSHKPLQPHDKELRYNEKTGKPDHYMCKNCHTTLPLDT